MTIEEQLKQYIIEEYGSVRAFTIQKELTYASVDSILRRGIKNTTWTNVKKLCAALEISTDELAENRIVKVKKPEAKEVKIEDIFHNLIQQLISTDYLTIEGKPATKEDVYLIISTLETTLDIRKRQHQWLAEYYKLLNKKDEVK